MNEESENNCRHSKPTITFEVVAGFAMIGNFVLCILYIMAVCNGYHGDMSPKGIIDYIVYNEVQTPTTLKERLSEEGLLFENSDTELIQEGELYALKKINDYAYTDLLKRAKCEIYARHGKLSKKNKFHKIFSKFKFYQKDKPKAKRSDLNSIERENVDLINEFLEEATK